MKKNDKELCPMSKATKLIGDFWSILIIRELLKSELRFSDLEDRIDDITSSTLSSKLKILEEEKVIIRTQYQCIPPKVIYSLTNKGKALAGVISSIEDFSDEWYK